MADAATVRGDLADPPAFAEDIAATSQEDQKLVMGGNLACGRQVIRCTRRSAIAWATLEHEML